MPKPIPLDEQIVASLTGIATSEQVAAVLADAERAVREEAERVATLKRRDELAADIAATYPRIVADLTALAKRIEDAGSIGASAEALGRGIAENFYHAGGPVMRIGEIQLPMPGSGELAFDYRPVTFQPGGELTASGRVWRGLELLQEDAA